MMRPTLFALVLCSISACSNWQSAAPVPDAGAPAESLSCAASPDPHCDHPVDRELVPLYRRAGLPMREAPRQEICRRMAIDLLGRIPTLMELDACAAQTPAQMADAFMALPEYERSQRRQFAELLENDAFRSWFGYLREMDALVGAHLRNEFRYEELIARLVTHPGFYARNMLDDWSRATIRLAFGRPARADEIAGLRPLTLPWQTRAFADGRIFYNYRKALGPDPSEADISQFAVKSEYALNLCACYPGGGSPGCRSSTLGAPIDWGVYCPNPTNGLDAVNFVRLTDASPGHAPTCPDGTTASTCADRAVTGFDEVTMSFIYGGALTPWPAAPDSVRTRVLQFRDAFAARGDLYEAAADRALRKLLGWWQSGFRRPDYDLPAVRQVLAEELKRSGNLRTIQRLIVTSLLYVSPAEIDPAAASDPPLWAAGPSKYMGPEDWLDSVASMAGEQAGICDFRWVAIAEFIPNSEVDPALLEPFSSTLPTLSRDEYERWARQLGGCSAEQARPLVSSVGALTTEEDYAQLACALGRGVLPTGFTGETSDGALDAITQHLFRRGLARAPDTEERDALRAEMRECLAQPAGTGCDNAESAARWACHRIATSAPFNVY